MKRKRIIIITSVILFMCINILLVSLDTNDNIERKSYVKSWTKTIEMDMHEYLDKDGVLISTAEESIYFDENIGSFEKFIASTGDRVNIGDDLYSYRAENYYETEAHLQNEEEKVNEEITAIETALAAMNSYVVPQTPQYSVSDSDEDDPIEISQPAVEVDFMKQEYTIEQEKELAQKNAQLDTIQAQLTDLQASGDTITVESPYQGRVTVLSKTLTEPLITIEATELQIEADLTEKERLEIEEGLSVEIVMKESEADFEGTISRISEAPRELAIDKSSIYPFNVAFVDEEEDAEESETEAETEIETETTIEDLLPGYHVELAIITKESLGATVASDTVLFGNILWKMTKEGTLKKQKVETGIHMNKKQEIIQGADSEEMVAKEPSKQFRSEAPFVTPLKLKEMKWKKILKAKKKIRNKHFVIGLLSR